MRLLGTLPLCVMRSLLLASAVIVALGGCGDAKHSDIVVRVGHVGITRATVEHWTSTMAGGRVASDPVRRQAQREQALDFVISSQWRLGEAGENGIELSPPEVARQVASATRASFPNGPTEMREFLKATGTSASDLRSEASAELAVAKLRQMLARKELPITQAQVAAYYAHNKQRFLIPERRELYIMALKSPAAVQAMRRKVAAGERLASVAKHQSIELSPFIYGPSRGEDAVLARAIHLASPHVLTGPVRVHSIDYYLFEVLSVTPARQQTLAQTRGSITHQLTTEQQKRTLAAFLTRWRQKWIARTSCSPGWVVQKCRQYSGPRTPEDPATLD